MKKMLRNVALLGASFLVLGEAHARSTAAAGQGPVLSLGGSITAAGVAVNQKVRLQGNPPATTIMSKGNLVVNVGGTSANGMTYGAVGTIDFDRSKFFSIKEAYVFMNSDCFGTINVGDTDGIAASMMYSGTDILGGLGGAGGDLGKLFNPTRGVLIKPGITPTFDTASKIVWISPEMKGFQVGLDFTPSTKLAGRFGRGFDYGSTGSTTNSNALAAPYSNNLVAGGLSWNKAFTNHNIGLYAVGHTGKGKIDSSNANSPTVAAKIADTRGYQLGALVDYQNWQVGGSYFDNKQTGVRKDLGAVNSTTPTTSVSSTTNIKGYDVAVGYDFARNANVAVGYTHTERKALGGKAKGDITTVTLDYVVAPGWVAFAEVDYFKQKAPNATITTAAGAVLVSDIGMNCSTSNINNHGTVFILGTKLRF